LLQTKKLDKKMLIILYGSEFWKKVINFEALAEMGMIGEEDLKLFEWADEPGQAMQIIQNRMTEWYLEAETPLPRGEQKTPAISNTRN